MTEPQRPDDRELEQYLQGDSKLSRRYRDASGETSPPDLDEAILARARAEVRRKPSLNRYVAPVALAASVVLGVNLAWNLYRVEPVPDAERLAKSAEPVYAPDPPPQAKLEERLAREQELAAAASRERDERANAEAKDLSRAEAEPQALAEPQQRRMLQAQDSATAGAAAPAARPAAPAAAPAPAEAAPMTEAQKIERLIDHVAQLDDVVFIRNGKEHSAADAADHMRLKLERAGDRVKTAEDFIRLCASFSTRSGEAYLIRFPDGRTRTAEDVLREQLATMR